MSETVRLSNFASIANAVFNSVSANATAITGISVGGAVINATSLSAATNTFTVGTAAYFVANGNVGIGTSSPVQPLQVNANIRATAGGTNSIAEIRGGNADGAVIQLFRAGNTSQFAGFAQFQGSLFIKNVDSGPTIFTTTTGDVERMRISADGNVGIGVSNPTYRLSTLFAAGTLSPSALTRGAVLSTSYTRNDNSEFVSRQISVGATQFVAFAQAEDFNLNAMPLAINPNGGNVGIGTTAPGVPLEVSSATVPQIRLIRPSGVDLRLNAFFASTDLASLTVVTNHPLAFQTNNTERMRIEAGGNIGIGATSARAQLHIFGSGQTTSALTDAGNRGGMLRVSDNSTSAGAGGTVLFASLQGDGANSLGFAAIKGLLVDGSNNTAGDLAFSTRGSTAATALAERMRITFDGNVGIGTGSPVNARLHVLGTGATNGLKVESTSTGLFNGAGIYLRGPAGTNRSTALFHTNFNAGGTNTGFNINTYGDSDNYLSTIAAYDYAANFWAFSTNSSERIRITADGSVGIGLSTPSYRLDAYVNSAAADVDVARVVSDANPTGNSITHLRLEKGGGFGGSIGGYINQGIGSGLVFSTLNSGTRTNLMWLTSGGNVGIGTSTPGGRLNVSSNRAAIAYSQVWTVLNGGSFENDVILGYQGTHTFFGNFQNNPLTFVTNNLERMRITAAGNVGIGTSSPANRLQISTAGYGDIGITDSSSSRTAYLGMGGGDGYVGATGASNFQLQTNGLSRMLIDSNGNIRIGDGAAVSNDGRYIDIYNTGAGSSSFSIIRLITQQVSSTNLATVDLVKYKNGMFAINNNDTNAATNIMFSVGGVERMRIDANGNVGIGTSSPGGRLNVAGGRAFFGPSNELYAIGVGFNQTRVNSGQAFYIGATDSATPDMVISNVFGSEALRITNAGNINVAGTYRARNANYTFTLPNAGGATNWIFLGTFTAPQTGHHVYIKVVTSTGYNADITQQSEIHIHFKTSNGSSVDANGFAGDATFYVTNAHPGPPYVVKVRGNVAGVSATSYDIFLQQTPFNGDGSFYTVELGNQFTSSWTNSSTISTDPGVASSTVAVASQRFLVQSNVGIGTSSPLSRLTVGGVISVDSGNVGAVNFWSGAAFFGSVGLSGAVLGDSSNDIALRADGAGRNIRFFANSAERARITTTGDFQFNSGYGSVATAFGCRAWVNFNGVGTVAIRGSGNVSSITDNGVGDYIVNFTTAMPDVNYCVAGTGTGSPGNYWSYMCVVTRATGTLRVQTMYGHSQVLDSAECGVAIFR